MCNKKASFLSQKGLTIMESVLVITLVFFVFGSAVALFQQADSSAKGTRAARQLVLLANNVNRVYMTRPIYHPTGATTPGAPSAVSLNDYVRDKDGIPAIMDSNGQIENIWEGVVNIYDDSHNRCYNVDNENNKRNFCVEYRGLPNSACTFLATRGGIGGATQVGVNPEANTDMARVNELDISGLVGNCTSGGDENVIVWFFGN